MGMICDCEPFEVCPSCAPPWRGVETKPAPCQHNHAANYDPSLVAAGKPVEVLSGGQLKCFDCGEEIAPSVEVPRTYTLEKIEALAKEFLKEKEIHADDSITALALSRFAVWLAKREKELRG